jgi:hypothetical protein
MTIEDVGPVVLPAAIGIAIAAIAGLFWYVARRYPTAPKRIPTGIRIDGRPGRLGTRRRLWVAPCMLLAIIAIVGSLSMALRPIPDEGRATVALVFLIIAQVAWFVAWTMDRQIELARGMTHRVAPARMLRVFFPIAATIVFTLFLAIRPAS